MPIIAVLFLAIVSISGCAGVRQLAALHQVEFRFDRIADPRIAGIQLSGVRSLDNLSLLDAGRLTLAIASSDVPLDLTVHVVGTNPETNTVTAKLIGLDWSYILDAKEVVSGQLTEGYEFPPGKPTDLPLRVTFNLVDFFGSDSRSLIDAALALSGQRTSKHTMTMRLRPVIETPMGPMRYPTPLDINLETTVR
jgi:hypothetical protein